MQNNGCTEGGDKRNKAGGHHGVEFGSVRIKMLERKVEEESHGWENVDQYESDKMILDNLKK